MYLCNMLSTRICTQNVHVDKISEENCSYECCTFISMNMVAQFQWLDNYAGSVLCMQSVTSYFYFFNFGSYVLMSSRRNAHSPCVSIAGFFMICNMIKINHFNRLNIQV